MNFLCSCIVFVISTVCAAEEIAPLIWPRSYTVEGALHLPNDDHERPFQAWFDGTQRRSRIDYFNGMVKTVQRGTGKMTKIIPTSDPINESFNFTVCYSQNRMHRIQPTLPVVQRFIYIKDVVYRNWTAKVFVNNEYNGMLKIVEKLLVRYSGNDPIPIRYEVEKFARERNHMRVYEHYYLEYYFYAKRSISSTIFDIEPKVCRNRGTSEYLNPMQPFIPPRIFASKSGHFGDFVGKFRKQYKDEFEREYRKGIFMRNLGFIESENRANRGFKLAINQFADLTDEEYASMLGDRPAPDHFRATTSSEDMRQVSFPDEFDWRISGAVTPVKSISTMNFLNPLSLTGKYILSQLNHDKLKWDQYYCYPLNHQLHCGASYAFAAVGAIESGLFIKTGNLLRLSEQAIIDCSWSHTGDLNEGCFGGSRENTFSWIFMMDGIPLDGDYIPFLGMEGYCNLSPNSTLELFGNISNYVRVTANDTDALKLAIFEKGPVTISIDASPNTFKFYSSGVYFDPNCNSSYEAANHAALAIGYGRFNNQDYWIVKNSWSTYWGLNGYILISTRNNNCGVTSQPVYVTMGKKL